MRLAKLGKKRKPFTEEHKAKLRAGKLLYHPLKGKHHTKETIEKLKDAHRRKGQHVRIILFNIIHDHNHYYKTTDIMANPITSISYGIFI